MKKILPAILAVPLCLSTPAGAIHEVALPTDLDVWQPAATPRGGTSWQVLEATSEITRFDSEGYIISRPVFTEQVRRLEGTRIRVAGWMDAFEPGRRQTHFILLGYPPGCPFHFHAAPNQFIEVKATRPFSLSDDRVIVVEGVLELTGEDESGIFYVLNNARPV